MSEDSDSPLQIEGFRFIRRIGGGGMGEVYLARESDEGHLVAVKILSLVSPDDDAIFERFFREAIIASRLRHPNIVRVYELGEVADRYFISMEFVNGPSLRNRLMAGALPFSLATSMFYPILEAMESAHVQGIVHCDIKPGNILLAGGSFPKVSDLGIAHTRGPIHGDSPLPVSARATPYYVAPEQCARDAEVDHRADIYSLGATFYHMLCGRPPFTGKTPLECVEHHQSTPAPDPRQFQPSLSKGLAEVVLRMLAKAPGERYQRCADIVEGLRGCGALDAVTVLEPPMIPHKTEAALEETTTKLPPV